MSSSGFPHRFRSLIVICLAIGMLCSGFSLPLISAAEASVATPASYTCCCGLDGNCGMGCCVLRAPAVPETPVPASPPNERAFAVAIRQTELLGREPKAVPRAGQDKPLGELLLESSLQSLQVRLDI